MVCCCYSLLLSKLNIEYVELVGYTVFFKDEEGVHSFDLPLDFLASVLLEDGIEVLPLNELFHPLKPIVIPSDIKEQLSKGMMLNGLVFSSKREVGYFFLDGFVIQRQGESENSEYNSAYKIQNYKIYDSMVIKKLIPEIQKYKKI